uniref:Uncharacterized protein n=1 Tax=Glossina pallidipes TaxID=7398 RepID=A0A1A9ZAF8_GLOPL
MQISSMRPTSSPTTGPIHNNIITSMAGRISTSTFPATNAVTATTTATVTAAATTTTTATVKPRRKPAAEPIVLQNTLPGTVVDNKIQIMPTIEEIAATTTTTAQIPNSGMEAHNAAPTGTASGDNQTKQMHLVAILQTPNSGSSPAISIPNSSKTFTTPTLSIPQQINHTPTNLTATIPMAAMTPVLSKLSGMAVNVNLSVCSPATIAALSPQLTGSLTLAVLEQCERLILRQYPSQPPDEQSHTIRWALLTGAVANVTITKEPSKVGGINKIPLHIPTPQPSISIADTSCSTATTSTSTLGTASTQTKKAITQKQNGNANTGDCSSSSKQALEQSPDLGSMKVGSVNSAGLSQQQRCVALPTIDPSFQQSFSPDTLNNEITPISSNQTTASIAPILVPATLQPHAGGIPPTATPLRGNLLRWETAVPPHL